MDPGKRKKEHFEHVNLNASLQANSMLKYMILLVSLKKVLSCYAPGPGVHILCINVTKSIVKDVHFEIQIRYDDVQSIQIVY